MSSTIETATALVVYGHPPGHAQRVPVSVELVEGTDADGVQLALRVGHGGQRVILPQPAASELIANLSRALLAERLAGTGKRR